MDMDIKTPTSNRNDKGKLFTPRARPKRDTMQIKKNPSQLIDGQDSPQKNPKHRFT